MFALKSKCGSLNRLCLMGLDTSRRGVSLQPHLFEEKKEVSLTNPIFKLSWDSLSEKPQVESTSSLFDVRLYTGCRRDFITAKAFLRKG